MCRKQPLPALGGMVAFLPLLVCICKLCAIYIKRFRKNITCRWHHTSGNDEVVPKGKNCIWKLTCWTSSGIHSFRSSFLHGVRTFIFTHALLACYFASFSALSHSGRCQQAVQESSRAYDVCLFSVTIKKRQS